MVNKGLSEDKKKQL